MALANAAYLASRRSTTKGVLIIDWDLEAPGLDRYFADRMHDVCGTGKGYEARFRALPGLIDFFVKAREVQRAWKVERRENMPGAKLLEQVAIDEFILETDLPRISLIKAGRFDAAYGRKVGTFNWEEFYQDSPDFFARLAEDLASRFAYVFIDSRTGITDTSGICTTLMPEKLVTVFTPNNQSIGGVIDHLREVSSYRRKSPDPRPLGIFPLPSRLDASEPGRLRDWRKGNGSNPSVGYQPAFEALMCEIYAIEKCDLTSYLDAAQIQHVAGYSYGERIATLEESSTNELSMASSYRRFLDRLIDSPLPWIEPVNQQVAASELQQSRIVADELHGKLQRSERSSRLLKWSLGGVATAVLVLTAIAIPAYQDFTTRAQIAEGLNLAAAAKASVSETFLSTRTFPNSNTEAGLGSSRITGKYVSSIDTTQHGVIAITFGNEANSAIASKQLQLTPYLSPTLDVIWLCRSSEIKQRYLVASCRDQQSPENQVSSAMFDTCVGKFLEGQIETQPFEQSGGVRCESAGVSGRGKSRSDVVTFNAPPGFVIHGTVRVSVTSNIDGTYGAMQYNGTPPTSVSVPVACRSQSKPFGPGASMQIQLQGTIRREKPSDHATQRAELACAAPAE